MKLASLKHGRDGRLVVVSQDLNWFTDAFRENHPEAVERVAAVQAITKPATTPRGRCAIGKPSNHRRHRARASQLAHARSASTRACSTSVRLALLPYSATVASREWDGGSL